MQPKSFLFMISACDSGEFAFTPKAGPVRFKRSQSTFQPIRPAWHIFDLYRSLEFVIRRAVTEKKGKQVMKTKVISAILFLTLFLTMTASATSLSWTSQVMMTPEAPKSGDTITFQAKISAGRTDETHFTVIGNVDGRQLFNRSYDLLKAGKSRMIRFRWKASAGSHTVYFKIIPKARPGTAVQAPRLQVKGQKTLKHDPLSLTRRFTVGVQQVIPLDAPKKQLSVAKVPQPVCTGQPLPDIVTRHISIHGGARPGDEIRIQATIENKGQCATGQFRIKAEVQIQDFAKQVFKRVPMGEKTLRSLQPCTRLECQDAMTEALFRFTSLNEPEVTYTFSVYPDFDFQVDEFNEENNEYEGNATITIRAQ